MTAASSWLLPLRRGIPELDGAAWNELHELSDELAGLAANAPSADEQGARSRWLTETRGELVKRHHGRTLNPGADLVWQTLAQFCAGFYDLDLRDSIGPGHGAMILADGTAATAEHWQDRLSCGDLVGIAATERHGGSRIREISTRAKISGKGWLINGEKAWVSRLVESAAFVVFFRDPANSISAGIVHAANPGLEREVIDPFGMRGWSWGVLRLHDVPLDPRTDLVGRPGAGLDVFQRHFARFRPLVTATALGAAAGVHACVTVTLATKCRSGVLRRIRDNALITIGRTRTEITAALLHTLTTSRLAAAGSDHADLFARLGKAVGVDIAYRAVADLAPLVGADGFRRCSPIAKARADLTGLLYADGIHDALYRSGGLSLVRQASPQQTATPFSR